MNDRPRRPAGARRRTEGGEGEESPRRKKNTVQMNPVVGILVLFVLPLVFVAIFAWAWLKSDAGADYEGQPNDEGVIVDDDNKKFEDLKKKKFKKAQQLYRKARQAKMNEDITPQELKVIQNEAREYIALVKEELDQLLDPLRDAEGMLPTDYSGYQKYLRDLNTWQLDLLKESSF